MTTTTPDAGRDFRRLPRATKGGRGHAVAEDRDVLEAAIDRARQCYRRFDHVYASCSGGKDSTSVVEVAVVAARAEGRLPVHVVFWDEEAIPHSAEDYMRRLVERDEIRVEWLAVPIMHRNACSDDHPHWYPWAPEDEASWCRPLPTVARAEATGTAPEWWTFAGRPADRPSIPVAQSIMATSYRGTVCALFGNRAAESLRRRMIITGRAGSPDAWITHRTADGARNLFVAYPIYDWSTADVWTAIGAQGWDYCDYYDLMEMAGVPAHLQRLGPPFGEEPLQRLWTYREIDPVLWDRLSRRVPGANAAAMYSRTTLYGYGDGDEGGVERPAGMTWQEAVTHAIERHTPDIQPHVAYVVRRWIELHYRTTSEPILDEPHPLTAISWPWLYRIALRGDTKRRRTPPRTSTDDRAGFDRRHAAYHAALAAHRAEESA